jgi:tetratricopeptide (TPR) repeat protein
MSKFQLILIIASVALVVIIYSLPKVVVDNAEAAGGRQANEVDQEFGMEAGSNMPAHMSDFSIEEKAEIAILRNAVSNSPVAAEINDAAGKLTELYKKYSRFDSAAHYAGILANNQPTEANLKQAAFLYFDAYSFSVAPEKVRSNADKASDLLKKVIEKNEEDLEAKTRLGLIMVNSPQPMQGILMVREVLEKDPENEFALFNMGLLSIESRQFPRAVEYFERYQLVNPANEEGQLYLAISYLESGNKAKAQETFTKLRERVSDPELIRTIDQYTERLK